MPYSRIYKQGKDMQSVALNIEQDENEEPSISVSVLKKNASRKTIDWLEVYQQGVTGRSSQVTEALPKSLKVNVSEEPDETILPKPRACGADAVNGSGRYLVNQGSEPIGIDVMKSQIAKYAISIFDINKENAIGMVDVIINGHERAVRNEYIFAYSETRGLRVLSKGFGMGFNELAFHHQNIFTGRLDILSAGTMYVDRNRLVITNFSGHFKPSVESLSHLERFLMDAGVSKKKFKISDYSMVGSVMEGGNPLISHWLSRFLCCLGGR